MSTGNNPRGLLSWLMVFVFPLSMMAADTNSAIVHGNGGVWVNGDEVADSITIFPGDSIETKPGFVANLDAEGSSVLIQPESIVKFQGNYLVLEHGGVAVGTSTALEVHVNCIRVEPVTSDRTQYEVADLSGRVEVAARKNDVRIRESAALRKTTAESVVSHSGGGIVHEGNQESREESLVCGAASPPQTAGHLVNTKWLEIGGGGAGVGLLCLLLCKGKPSSSVSPSSP